jgi:hypothetical protein
MVTRMRLMQHWQEIQGIESGVYTHVGQKTCRWVQGRESLTRVNPGQLWLHWLGHMCGHCHETEAGSRMQVGSVGSRMQDDNIGLVHTVTCRWVQG